MKILQIIPSMHGGGAEKFVIDLSNEFSKNDEVIICSLYNIKEDMFMLNMLSSKIKIITLNKKPGLDLHLFVRLYKIIKEEQPDVINTHLRALLYSILPIVFTNIPFFHTVHNMAENETGQINRKIYKLLFKFFNVKPISISNKVLESVHKIYGKEYSIMIENGVQQPRITNKNKSVKDEINLYKMNSKTKVFLSIGRITEQKNHKMLVQVFSNLINNGENIILLIIGQDTSKKKFFEKELKLLIKDKIFLLGMKENIADYLYYSDAFCLSSLYEGLPITLLESLAMGIIPICTPAGGIPDVIDNQVGLISNDFSLLNYKHEVEKFLKMKEEKISYMKKEGISLYLSKYCIETTAINYKKIYFDV